MIGRLQGIVTTKQPPWLLIDVGGVGYEVEAPMSTFYELPQVGEPVILFTHLAVREDAHTLYGFASESERRMFRTLIRISGVGPKLALTILSGISATALVQCVEARDTSTLTQLPGVGKKTAERLLVEMADRIKEWGVAAGSVGIATGTSVQPTPLTDAKGALVALGYKPQEVERMVASVASEELSSEEIIRQALQTTVRTT